MTLTDPGNPVVVFLAAILGLLFGSFGSVVSFRVLAKMVQERAEEFQDDELSEDERNELARLSEFADEGIVRGRSKCPACGAQLTAIENIPLFSYLIQKGKCRSCGQGISLRYPLTELASGILFAGAAAKFGLTVTGVAFAAFFWVLLVLSVIDLESRLLPSRIVYPAFVVGWVLLIAAALVDSDADRLVDAAIGAAVCGGLFVIVSTVGPAGGMGGGDVRLSFLLGTFLGYYGGLGLVAVGMFMSFLIGAVFGIGSILFSGAGRKSKVPFGPFLALGSVTAIFVGTPVLDWYLRLV